INRNRIPYHYAIDAIIFMPHPVPSPTNAAPRQTGAQRLRLFTEAHRRFAVYLQFAFDSRNRLWIFPESIKLHVLCELLDGSNSVTYIRISAREREGSLKGKAASRLALSRTGSFNVLARVRSIRRLKCRMRHLRRS